jgi:pyrimidine operon attenuation protein / uracil phosphoribosyltransferase
METAQVKNCVLQKEAVARKLRRIALEIAEQNAGEEAIIVAAINGNGEVVAEKLVRELKAAADWEVSFTTIQLNKKDPVLVALQPSIDFENKVVLIVDDVANSGKTMMYALKPFLTKHPKKVQTVALVERSHKLFPMHTDYTGLSIATTLQEHIVVETKDGEIEGAWLY